MHARRMGSLRGNLVLSMLQAISTLEMHGTGTPLGDPIEIGAASAVLQGAQLGSSPPKHVMSR